MRAGAGGSGTNGGRVPLLLLPAAPACYLPPMLRGIKDWLTRVGRTPALRRNVLVGVLAAVTLVLAVVVAAWTGACAGNTCPSIEGLDQYDPNQASKVYAADGRLITDLGLERRTVVSLDEMSPAVIAAFLTTEDKRF